MRVRRVMCRLALTWVVVSLVFVSRGRSGQLLALGLVPAPWSAIDIGSPALAGSSFLDQDTFTIMAGGTDIWNTSDQLHFAYQAVSGDVDVRARVDAVSYADPWSKAGVMIRGSLDPDAAHGYMLVSAGKGLSFRRRTVPGGHSTSTAGESGPAPRWVRLVRSGSQIVSYSSADGVSWTVVGSDNVALPATVYVGIAVVSHNAAAITTATVSQVEVAGQALPPGQYGVDVGGPALGGSAAYSAGTYTITGAGADVWGTADQFHYVYQQASGDLDVTLRVASIAYADGWSKAGLMIRQSLDPGSAHAFALASAANGYAFQRRAEDGGLTASSAGSADAPPGWVRLRRLGTSITAYQSFDGVNWTVMGSDSIAFADPFYVGMAVSSHNVAATTTAVLDQLSISQVQQSAPAAAVELEAAPVAAVEPEATPVVAVEFEAAPVAAVEPEATPVAAVEPEAAPAAAVEPAAAPAAALELEAAPVAAGPTPVTLTFTASADDPAVSGYVLEIFPGDAATASESPLYQLPMGKPAADAAGVAAVDITAFFNGLPAGSYQATVSAQWSSGSVRSEPFAVTR